MNRLNRTKGFISLRIASILSWIVLFVFINAVALVSTAGEDASPSIPAPAGAGGDAIIQPSAAFPSDTLLYLELNRVVESLDILSRMEIWPEARSMMASLALASRNMHLPLGMFIDGMASWGIPSEFRTHMQVLAGKRLVVGWIPVTGSDRPVAVFVFQGNPRPFIRMRLPLLKCYETEGTRLGVSASGTWVTIPAIRRLTKGSMNTSVFRTPMICGHPTPLGNILRFHL